MIFNALSSFQTAALWAKVSAAGCLVQGQFAHFFPPKTPLFPAFKPKNKPTKQHVLSAYRPVAQMT